MYIADEKRYDTMQYNRCGRSGLMLPAVSLGLWHNFGSNASFDNMQSMCHTAFDNGITHFDLANNYGPVYGAAEENFGRILAKGLGVYRDELVISTKAGYDMWPGPYGNWGSKKYLVASLDQSLRRMGLDYVDIYYHHRPDKDTPIEETAGALDGIGVITFCPLAQGLLTNRYIDGIPQDSRIRTDGRFLREDALGRETVDKVRALNGIAEERGQSLAQMALAWILRDGDITSVLTGASKTAQIIDNVGMLANIRFSVEELDKIEKICGCGR